MTTHKTKTPSNTDDKARRAFRRDLEKIFKLALAERQYATALKAKELLAKVSGLIPATTAHKSNKKKASDPVNPQELTDEVLEALIQTLAKSEN